MNNRNKNIHKTLYTKFLQNFNILPLYQYCRKVYMKNKALIGKKYNHLFSVINFANHRMIFQEKQQIFIKQWKKIIYNKVKINFTFHWQELITIIQLLTQKINKIQLYVTVLNQATKTSWDDLKNKMINKISQFLDKISKIIKRILLKYNKNQKIRQTLQLLDKYKAEHIEKKEKLTVKQEEEDIESNKESSLENQTKQRIRQSTNLSNSIRDSLEFLKLFSSSKQQRNSSFASYQISTAKFFMKEKHLTTQLMNHEELDALKKSLHQQYSNKRASRLSGFMGLKYCQTQGNQDNDLTSLTQLKKMTALQDLQQLQQSQATNNFQEAFQSGQNYKKVLRHHKSTCQDKHKISKMIQSKLAKFNFKSIRKIQNYSQAKQKNNTEIQRSTTKQHSTKKGIEAHSNNFKKDNGRNSTLIKFNSCNNTNSTKFLKRNGKHLNTYIMPGKQIEKNKDSFPQFIDKNRPDEDEISDEIQNDKESFQQQALEHQNIQTEIQQNLQRKFQDFAGVKKHKKKTFIKRFGRSMKKVLPSNSIDDILSKNSINIEERQSILSPKKKFNRTSLFRSSGITIPQKKSSIKSGFTAKSHAPKKLISKYVEQNSKVQQIEILNNAKQNKKSNKSIINDVNGYKIDKNALVNTLQMNNIFIQIHEQQKRDRQDKYSDYYDEILRRKYQNSVNFYEIQLSSCQDKFFKLDSFITQVEKTKPIFNKQNKYMDFMKKHISINQNSILQQSGVDIDDMN